MSTASEHFPISALEDSASNRLAYEQGQGRAFGARPAHMQRRQSMTEHPDTFAESSRSAREHLTLGKNNVIQVALEDHVHVWPLGCRVSRGEQTHPST